MKTRILMAVSVLILGAGCKKERLDIEASQCFGIQELLDSRNAAVDCGQTADFEGKSLCLTGILEESNDPGETRNFLLLDSRRNSRYLQIKLDSTIAAEVIELVRAHKGESATVKGVLTGFDAPQNTKCRRGFEQNLMKISDLEIQ